MLSWPVTIATLATVLILFYWLKKKRNNACKSNSDCGEKEKCSSKGLCCSTDCSGMNCSQSNACGDSCNFCDGVEKCIDGNCQRNLCSEFNCDETCTCPAGKICYQNQCCQPQDCTTGVCGGEGSCGLPPCSCNDRYCGTGQPNTGACCNSGSCTYEDICNGPAGIPLSVGWGKFCSRDSTGNPECTNCRLTNALFKDKSLAPISGTLTCDKCKGGNTSVTVSIDKDVGAYISDGKGSIIGQANTCSDNCTKCACVYDDDCKHVGCATCIGGSCVK